METRRNWFGTVALLSLVAACVSPEQGINRASIQGVVEIPPIVVGEKGGNNDVARYAQKLDPLRYAITVVSGEIAEWGTDAGTGAVTGDQDFYQISSPTPVEATSFLLRVPQGEEGAIVRISWWTPSDEGEYFQTSFEDVTVTGEMPFEYTIAAPLEADVVYAMAVGGASGTAPTAYELILPGAHPDDAGIIVGAYRSQNLYKRMPVAGASAGPFTLQEDWSYTAEYSMLLVRSVREEPVPFSEIFSPEDLALIGLTPDSTHLVVNEDIKHVWIFAGNWPTLTGGLPAGTWYSGTPAEAKVTCGGPREDEEIFRVVQASGPVALDSYAPLVIGREVDETEPNDIPVNGDGSGNVSDPLLAQDVGVLSGPGFVDIFRGTQAFETDADGWVHDVDAFKFTVPEPVVMGLTLSWADASDIDLLVYDGEGLVLDYAASLANPEVGGYEWEYLPEEMYFLVVAGYTAETPGTAPAYELLVEQSSP